MASNRHGQFPADKPNDHLAPADSFDHLEQLVVRERGKLARQLHDEVASAMFAAKLSLDVASGLAARGATGDELRSALDDATRFANAAMSALRVTCAGLGEPSVKDEDIFRDLADVLRDFERETGTRCGLSIRCDCTEFERESAAGILETVREKLSEIAGRADVDRVQVDLLAKNRQYDLRVRPHAIGESPSQTSVSADFPPVRGGNDTKDRTDGPTHPAGATRKNRNAVKTARRIKIKAEAERPPAVTKMPRQPAGSDQALGSE